MQRFKIWLTESYRQFNALTRISLDELEVQRRQSYFIFCYITKHVEKDIADTPVNACGAVQ